MTYEKLGAAVKEQVARYPRYRRVLTGIMDKFRGPRFVDCGFQVRDHIETNERVHTRDDFERVVGEFFAIEWDLKRPLWSLLWLPNFKGDDGAVSALVCRAHHTLADGQGFVSSQLFMTRCVRRQSALTVAASAKISSSWPNDKPQSTERRPA